MNTWSGRERPVDGHHVVWCANELGIAEVGRVCIVLWRRNVTADRFRRQEIALADLVHRYPRRAGFMCVVEAGTTPPEDRLRRASADMVNSHGDRLQSIACVIEGSGFRASLTRSALTTMSLLVTHREIKFTATVTAAAGWLAPRCGVSNIDQIVNACESMRAQLAYEASRQE